MYRCPNCGNLMQCISTTSIPPIITYRCFSCGYTSKPIKEEWPDATVLPEQYRSDSFIPEACRNCSNHPSNGGSGICNCTLGLPKITWCVNESASDKLIKSYGKEKL